jgi:hypothetical protein
MRWEQQSSLFFSGHGDGEGCRCFLLPVHSIHPLLFCATFAGSDKACNKIAHQHHLLTEIKRLYVYILECWPCTNLNILPNKYFPAWVEWGGGGSADR